MGQDVFVCLFVRGHTQIDSFTQNVQWTFGGEGVKGLDVFKIYVSLTFFPRIFCKKLLQLLFAECIVSGSERISTVVKYLVRFR